MIMYLGVLRKSLKQINHRILTILLSLLPSDKSATPHFHQFGELTAEKRFLFDLLDMFFPASIMEEMFCLLFRKFGNKFATWT